MAASDLDRFVTAQVRVYEQALAELRNGEKRSHWMWFVFPQFRGLGHSEMSRQYAIQSLEEASAYLAHPLLGARLRECARAALDVHDRTALQIFGSIDAMKLRSSATLFAQVSPAGSVFQQVIDKYFGGVGDERTTQLIQHAEPNR